MMNNTRFSLLVSSLALLGLSACGSEGFKSEAKYPTGADRATTGADNIYEKPESVFGGDGIGIFGGKKKADAGDTGIGVNSFLWRAALDTVSFMPLASADPFGGVILTDWYTPEENANERFKINVFILGRQLRSDGIRVRIFKQVAAKEGWVDSEVAATTVRQMEDSILTRARQLRVADAKD